MTDKEKREEAIYIIDKYCLYHGGTAIIIGAFGGQFGADTIALSALTIKMIESICNIYGISDRASKNIHIIRALGRLTFRGNMLAKTILNYIPMGSVANGATSYFLTRSAGMQCIEEIENNQMHIKSQLSNSFKDLVVTAATSSMGDILENVSDNISEDFIESIKQTLDCDVSHDIGLDKIVSYLDKISVSATSGIDKAIGVSFRNTVIACMKGDIAKVGSPEMLSKIVLNALGAAIQEEATMSEDEIRFRIFANDKHAETFEAFLKETTDRYVEIEKQRGTLESLQYAQSAMLDLVSVYYGMYSKDMLKTLADNPYDKTIEICYKHYIPIIAVSTTIESALAKTAILYFRLVKINRKFRSESFEFSDNVDDHLIYMISGRIVKSSGFISNICSQKQYAYMLSERIRNNKKSIMSERNNNKDSIISYWNDILKYSTTDADIWSIGYMIYECIEMSRNQTDEIALCQYKDDVLFYEIASCIHGSNPILMRFSIEQVAYFIAEYYDSLFAIK